MLLSRSWIEASGWSSSHSPSFSSCRCRDPEKHAARQRRETKSTGERVRLTVTLPLTGTFSHHCRRSSSLLSRLQPPLNVSWSRVVAAGIRPSLGTPSRSVEIRKRGSRALRSLSQRDPLRSSTAQHFSQSCEAPVEKVTTPPPILRLGLAAPRHPGLRHGRTTSCMPHESAPLNPRR